MTLPARLVLIASSTAPSTAPGAVAASIAGSTAAADYPWLAAYVELRLAGREGQAESARLRSLERSKAIRQRIRDAVGVLPLDGDLATLVGIVSRRMGRTAPCDATIRDELRAMRKKLGISDSE